MKTKIYIAILTLSCLYSNVHAQWNFTGDVVTTTEWLGANAGSIIPLHLRTIPPLDINFSTFNVQRMTIKGNNTSNYGSWINNTGYVGFGMVDDPLSQFSDL